MSVPRFIVCIVCAIGLARPLACAQQTAADSSSVARPAELAALLAAQPKWSTYTALTTSFGYKDNLLLSHAAEERSAFARGNIEFLLLRVPYDRVDYSLFANTSGTRYFSGDSVEDEARVWVQSDLGYRLGDALKFALPITGYYSDQVFDMSETDVERLVAELKVGGIVIGPNVRWRFLRSWWVEAQVVGERKRYDDHANDGRVGEGNVSLGWAPGERFEARVTGARRWRDFDQREKYNSVGRPIPDTRLKIAEDELQLRFDVEWDRAGRWETSTRVGVKRYADNGSGYFNFSEARVDHEVEWSAEDWMLRLSGEAARVEFGVQRIGLGISPSPRVKDEYLGRFAIERKLSARWTLLAGYSWERSRSNDAITSYVVNEGLLGARWSWDK